MSGSSLPCRNTVLAPYIFSMTQQPPRGPQGSLISEAARSYSDTPQSVGLLWRSDQPDVEPCTSQHTTLTNDRLPSPRWDSNPQSQQATATDPRLKTPWRSLWGRSVVQRRPTECVCVCVSSSLTRCTKYQLLQLQCVGRKVRTRKAQERKN